MTSWSGRKVLVTGGAGFVGTPLTRRLEDLGASVTVVDDFSSTSAVTPPATATVHKLSLPHKDFPAILAAADVDAVFHLAGAAYVPPSIDDPLGDLRQNAQVTLQVLEAVKRSNPAIPVIYTSSAAVYGSPETLPISETSPTVPVSPYGVSKLASEQYVTLYARAFGMRTASLRLFSVFGPGQQKQVVFDLIAKLDRDPRRLEVHGTGEESRDLAYVDDVVSALLIAMERAPLRGEAYNVASGRQTRVRDIVQAVISRLGVSPIVDYTGKLRLGDALHWIADISAIRNLGYRPSVDLVEGVSRVVAWFDGLARSTTHQLDPR